MDQGTEYTGLASWNRRMQDSNSFPQIIRCLFSSSVLLLFARRSIHLRVATFSVGHSKNKSSVYIVVE